MDTVEIIRRILEVYAFILLGRVIASWIPVFTNRPLDHGNPLVRILWELTEPVLAPIRRFAVIGMMDLSPLVALISLSIIISILESAG